MKDLLGRRFKIIKSLGDYPEGIEGVLLGCSENDDLWNFRIDGQDIIEAWKDDVELIQEE